MDKKFDMRWILSLFGTAVGVGILYLPIKAGVGGVWPVFAMLFVIFPMVYLSHRALSRFVCAASGDDKDITEAISEYFGIKVSLFLALLYFFAIFPLCLAYCVGITNVFESFLLYQVLPLLKGNVAISMESMFADGQLLPHFRAILAFVLVSLYMLVMLFSEYVVTLFCKWLVYPLCAILFVFSLYLIPYWNFESLSYVPDFKEFLIVVWLTLPVLVFSFNHSPAISTFTLSVKRHYRHFAFEKIDEILFKTSIMLLVFVMFFVFSSVLSLSPDEFREAREQNIPILSYFANKLDNPFISYGGPLVAFLAITSSFFGHYFGAREGAYGIAKKCAIIAGNKNPNLKNIRIICTSVMYVVMILVAFYNPSVLGFIESLGGPIITAILFLMPIVAIYRISKLKKLQNKPLDIFVFAAGVLTIITVIYGF